MAKIAPPKESLEGLKPLPPGVYDFRLDKFEIQKAKVKPGKAESINLNPVLTIINHPEFTGKRRLPENLNSQAGWVQKDFVHALGVPMDNGNIPGDFICQVHGPSCDAIMDHPDKFIYQGPLLGQTGKAEVVMTPNNKGGMRAAIKRYLCKIQGCGEYHNENLAG